MRIRPTPGYEPPWGELCVRNDMVVADWSDPDGWCGLGDLAALDDEGYLYLGRRLDGMINTGAYHVYPQEVQDAITALPYVQAALVRGEEDPTWGQAVTAYVVPAPDAPGEITQGIREALRKRLASYKIPKRIIPVPTLEDIRR